MKANKTSQNSTPEMRAKRLKRVRNLANLSREELCHNADINQHTLVGWENARFGGLSKRGATKVVDRIKQEGVLCSVEWLMEGVLPEPSVNPIQSLPKEQLNSLNEDSIIDYETAFFLQKNSDSVSLKVMNNGMQPYYSEGDIVGGKKRYGRDIETVIGHHCIVETDDGTQHLCNVREGERRNSYTLVQLNTLTIDEPSVIANIKLNFAAPVIWCRKKDPDS